MKEDRPRRGILKICSEILNKNITQFREELGKFKQLYMEKVWKKMF